VGHPHEQELQPVSRLLPAQGLSRCGHEHGEAFTENHQSNLYNVKKMLFTLDTLLSNCNQISVRVPSVSEVMLKKNCFYSIPSIHIFVSNEKKVL